MGKKSRKKREIPSTAVSSQPVSLLDRDWLRALLLLAAVFLTYQPVWYAGFIWDDDAHITANPCIIGPLGLKEIWTTSAAWYYPLSLTTFWIEHALWGLAPLPYHLVNVLLHGACAVTLWQVLRSLQVPGAWLGAALWALHPAEVETVAWVTELKNTQSTLFYLLAIFFFIRGLKLRTKTHEALFHRNDAIVLLFSLLAMTSKTSTVVLPLVLCLCAWWTEARWSWRTMARTIPIFALSLLASAITVWTVQLNATHDHSLGTRSLLDRLIVSGDVFWFYLGKIIWPSPLIFIYPRWEIHANSVLSYLPVLAAVILMATLWAQRNVWSRPAFFALAYFLIALLPVLGLIDQYFWRYSFVGDHFQYLASMGPLALIGAALSLLLNSLFPKRLQLQCSICAALFVVPSLLSWRQSRIYETEETLWADTLAKNPGCPLASNNLGNILLRKGRVEEAIALFRKSISIHDSGPDIHNSLGNALLELNQPDNAIAEYRNALKIDPANFGAYNNLGITYAQNGQANEAMIQYEKALEINPHYADAHNNLGNVLLQSGLPDDAIAQFQMALSTSPLDADAHNNLGWALLKKGQIDSAISHFQQAIDLAPTDLKARNNLGIALAQSGHLAEAIAQFQQALQINPRDPNAQNNLAHAQSLLPQSPSAQ